MPNWKKLIVSGSDATLNKLNVITSVTGSNLSVTDTATYNSVEFTNSNIMKFNQRYTGGANGSYFSNGEYQKVVTITPSGDSQNYQVVGRITAQNAGETHTVYFNAALRSNTLPDLNWTINYNEEYNGSRYVDPQLWVKETSTAGFIIAFKTLATIYGTVTIDFDVIPRAASQKANVTINQVADSEVTSIDTGFTAYDMERNLRNQNGNFTISGSVTADSFVGDGSGLTGIIADGTISSSNQIISSLNNQDVDFGTGHITAQRLTVTGSLSDWVRLYVDRVLIAKDLRHIDDSDTYLRFTDNSVQLSAGGTNTFQVSPSNVVVNQGGEDIDFRVESNNNANMLFVDGGNDRVGIGTDSLSNALDVVGTVSASAFIGDGSGLTGINASIVSSSTVSDTFTNVTAYTASHTLGTKDVIVNVFDDNDRMVIPKEITTLSTTSVGIDFFTAVTGRVVIGKAGHIVSGAADVDLSGVNEHILPLATNTYDLGSPTKQWRDLYLSSASLYIDGQKIISSNSDVLTFTTDVGQSIKLLETGADDIILQTDTGNIELKGTVEVLTGKKITDSAGTKILFGDSIGITGSIDLTGTVDGIDLQAFSSSVATGLAGAGGGASSWNELSDIPSGIVSSSAQLASDISGSFTSTSASFATTIGNLTSDYTELTNVPSGIVSGAAQITSLTSFTETFTTSSAVTASHNLGTKNVTVSIYDNNDFMIFPTSLKTHDTNNVYVSFNSSRTGRIVITK